MPTLTTPNLAQSVDDLCVIDTIELRILAGSLLDDLSSISSKEDRQRVSAADNDHDADLVAINAFLREYTHSPNTLRNYTKECLRYLLWARLVARKTVSSLNADDIYAFEHFLRRPPRTWCRPRVHKDHKDYKPFTLHLKDHTLNPHWRPFQGPLSDASVKLALATLKSLHIYLHDVQYAQSNPFKLRRHQSTHSARFADTIKHKALTERQWSLIQKTIAVLPDNTHRQRRLKIRSEYIVALFYYLGMRVSESVTATMGDFHCNKHENWWLTVTGRGSTQREIPVPSDMMHILQNYRSVVLDTTPLPRQSEKTPMINSVSGDKPLTANRIYKIVKKLFSQTARMLDDSTPTYATDKQYFENSTTHWLRHTYTTNLIDSCQCQYCSIKFDHWGALQCYA